MTSTSQVNLPIRNLFGFKVSTAGNIQIVNAHSCVMGEYSSRTGVTRWDRVVATTHREAAEEWLSARYPVSAVPVVHK